MKTLTLPGSKSISNRVLILAALSPEPIELHGLLDSDDTRYMQAALEAFGVIFKPLKKGGIVVVPPEKMQITDGTELFIGNAGTAARFLSALPLLSPGSFVLKGVKRMHQRPQRDLQKALSDLGVELGHLERDNYLPTRFTTIPGSEIPGSVVELSGEVSSQFLTALMLVAPHMPKGLTIRIKGSVPSWPYIDMTLELLRLWGVSFSLTGREEICITPGFRPPERYQVPADMSGASYPLTWSVLSQKPIEITNFGQTTLQGDEAFLEIIKKTGAQIERQSDTCRVFPADEPTSIGDIDWSAMPDVSMTGMILAAAIPGRCHFTGLESLRVKECDRIVAMEQLRGLGVEVEVQKDDVLITGSPKLHNTDTIIQSYDDHRIAMCFGVLKATHNLDFSISEPECVAKTWPNFWVELADWQDQLREVSAVILSRDLQDPGIKEYLIVKKPRKEHAWQFPQGGSDAGETGLQAAKRELAEECGADLVVKFKGEKPIGSYKYLFPKTFNRWPHDVKASPAPHLDPLPKGEEDSKSYGPVTYLGAKVKFFNAEHITGEVEVDGEEIIDHAWVVVDQLADYFDAGYLEVVRPLLEL